MAIKYSPKVGQILMCDFNGFKAPEMVKNRPIIILSTRPNGHKLVSVTCLSTAVPTKEEQYHLKMDAKHLPRTKFFRDKETWLKGDMVYTVGFDRLNLIKVGMDKGKRIYHLDRLSRDTMKGVYSCVLHGLNLGVLHQHL